MLGLESVIVNAFRDIYQNSSLNLLYKRKEEKEIWSVVHIFLQHFPFKNDVLHQ